MIQNIFWVFCLCLQLMTIQAQLDLPNPPVNQQLLPKQPQQLKTQNATPIPQQYLQQQPQQPQQLPPPQFINAFSPNYEFGQQQLPYPYHNFLPINNFQPRPVIQINNRPFPTTNNNNNNNNNTRPVNPYNVYGRLDNFGPGQFGHDYIGQLRPQPQLLNFPTNFGNYQRQNLLATPNPITTETVQTEAKIEDIPTPPTGQIPQPQPQPQPNYGQFSGVQGYGPSNQPGLQFIPNQPGYDPNGPINPPQFQPFAQNFGRFDFGHNVAPPQTIEHNLQVTGPTVQGRGLPPLNSPVVGFYGPPPNLGVFSYPTFAPGYNYQSGEANQFARPDPESETVQDPAINPK